MHERDSSTGLESADASDSNDHRKRLLVAACKLEAAKVCLQHRQTHETQEACRLIDEAKAALGWEEVEAVGEG